MNVQLLPSASRQGLIEAALVPQAPLPQGSVVVEYLTENLGAALEAADLAGILVSHQAGLDPQGQGLSPRDDTQETFLTQELQAAGDRVDWGRG